MRKTWWQTLGEFLSALVMSPTNPSIGSRHARLQGDGNANLRDFNKRRFWRNRFARRTDSQKYGLGDRLRLEWNRTQNFSAGWEVHVVLLSYSQSVHDPPSLLPYENKHCKALSHVHVDQHPFLCRAALRLQGRGFDRKILFRPVKVHFFEVVASCGKLCSL